MQHYRRRQDDTKTHSEKNRWEVQKNFRSSKRSTHLYRRKRLERVEAVETLDFLRGVVSVDSLVLADVLRFEPTTAGSLDRFPSSLTALTGRFEGENAWAFSDWTFFKDGLPRGLGFEICTGLTADAAGFCFRCGGLSRISITLPCDFDCRRRLPALAGDSFTRARVVERLGGDCLGALPLLRLGAVSSSSSISGEDSSSFSSGFGEAIFLASSSLGNFEDERLTIGPAGAEV